MEKKSNFSTIPNWLVGKFTGAEYTLYFKMYNGWCLMQDADGWYYRSLSKLKEDLNITCKNNNKLLERIKKFEEMGILTVKRGKQETNWYKFNEHFMFNNEEHTTNEGSTPKGYKGSTQMGYKKSEGVVPQKGTIYNTKENTKTNIHEPETIVHVPDNSNEVVDGLSVEGYDKNGLFYCKGVCFWDEPIQYFIKIAIKDGEGRSMLNEMYKDDRNTLISAIPQLDVEDNMKEDWIKLLGGISA